VNQAQILSSMIEEQMSLGDAVMLLRVRKGRYSLMEIKIPVGAPCLGTPLQHLGLPEHCVIAGVIRQGEIILPRGPLLFEVEDEVFALTDKAGAKRFAELFGRPPSEPPQAPARS
jgi:trk system potassium uptake protein